jgi:hypothetical protein
MKGIIRFFLACSVIATSTAFASPQLTVSPTVADIITPVQIHLSGLQPNEKVVISATQLDQSQRTWGSYATYNADQNGDVDPAVQAPLSGTYSNADSQGLFWSMHLTGDAKDPNQHFDLNTNPITAHISAQLADGTILRADVTRVVKKDTVQKTEIRDNGMFANLFLPMGLPPYPAVIVIGAKPGELPDDAVLAQFANHGYATLGIAAYKTGDPSASWQMLPTMIAWLKQQPNISLQQLTLIGGGTPSLFAASLLPEIKAVATTVDGGLVMEMFDAASVQNHMQANLDKQNISVPMANFPAASKEQAIMAQAYQTFFSTLFTETNRIVHAIARACNTNELIYSFVTGVNQQLLDQTIMMGLNYETKVAKKEPTVYQFIAYNVDDQLFQAAHFPYLPLPMNLTTDITGNLSDKAHNLQVAKVDEWHQMISFLEHTSEIR